MPNRRLSDKALKKEMLDLLFQNKSFRIVYKDDRDTCMRCWNLLQSDKDFRNEYNDILKMRIYAREEEVITGSLFSGLPLKVDNLGNADIAPGYLRQAEILTKQAQWLLERRVAAYSPKLDVTQEGNPLGVVILPHKTAVKTIESIPPTDMAPND